MAFIIQAVTSVIGGIAGYGLGGAMVFAIDGSKLDLRLPTALIGVLVGYFIGRLLSPRKKRRSAEAESE
jgi:hypothetical protein